DKVVSAVVASILALQTANFGDSLPTMISISVDRPAEKIVRQPGNRQPAFRQAVDRPFRDNAGCSSAGR
ncbi:MAG: hypothetical protein WAM60_07760, partial [Candidatus Promineifilaceae bacterium]